MRIAYVCADAGVPVFGQKGCSIHVQEVIRAFLKQGAEVELFAARAGGNPPSDLSNVRLNQLPVLPKGDTEEREKASVQANQALRDALEKAGRFNFIYERYSLWSFAAMEYAREINVPGILEVNAPLVEEQAKHRGLVNRERAERIAEKVFKEAFAVVAVSDAVAEYVSRRVEEKRRVYVVANGVNPARFLRNQKPSLPSAPGTFTVGFVGTLKPWHGLEYLIEAFAWVYGRNEKTRLLIVGDGPERERIEDDLRAKSLLDAVHFTGLVQPSEIPGLLASMDVAVAPYPASSDFYFSPLKVYEYMAAGLPVAASRIGQLENVIEDKINGLLVPAGDADALADALEELRTNRELRIGLGRAARASVVEKHTWDAVVRRVFEIAGFGDSSNAIVPRLSPQQTMEVKA